MGPKRAGTYTTDCQRLLAAISLVVLLAAGITAATNLPPDGLIGGCCKENEILEEGRCSVANTTTSPVGGKDAPPQCPSLWLSLERLLGDDEYRFEKDGRLVIKESTLVEPDRYCLQHSDELDSPLVYICLGVRHEEGGDCWEEVSGAELVEGLLEEPKGGPGSIEGSGLAPCPGAVPLLPKCCPLREALNPASLCLPSTLRFEPQFWRDEPPPGPVDILLGLTCQHGWFRLDPREESTDEFHVLRNGSLLVPFLFSSPLTAHEYCLDPVPDGNGSLVLPMICFPPLPADEPVRSFILTIYPIGCLLSVPFLLATLLAYTIIPELRTTEGNVLSCYVGCLSVAYICLALVQLASETMSFSVCVGFAFVMQFSFLAAFFWLNVICFNTWHRMSQTEEGVRMTVGKERRRMIWYSLYGWCGAGVVSLASLLLHLGWGDAPIAPGFGREACWFPDDGVAMYYFYGPVSVLLGLNLVFFVLTVRILHRSSTREQLHTLQQVTWRNILQKRKKLVKQNAALVTCSTIWWVTCWAVGGTLDRASLLTLSFHVSHALVISCLALFFAKPAIVSFFARSKPKPLMTLNHNK